MITQTVLLIVALISFSLAIRWGVDWRIAQQTVSPSDANRAIVPVLMFKHIMATVASFVLVVLAFHSGTI